MYISEDEKKVSKEYLSKGYVIRKIKNTENLEYIRKFIYDSSIKLLNKYKWFF